MGIMSSAANDRWREAQKECEILKRANDGYIKTATEQCLRIAALDAELARLRADLAVYHEERQELRDVLRVHLPPAVGTAIAEFDPQPSLVDAAKMLRAELAREGAMREHCADSLAVVTVRAQRAEAEVERLRKGWQVDIMRLNDAEIKIERLRALVREAPNYFYHMPLQAKRYRAAAKEGE